MRVCPTQPDLRGKPRHTCRSPSFCPSNTRPGPLDGRIPYSARPQRQTEADFSEDPLSALRQGLFHGRIPYSARPGWHTEADFSEDPLTSVRHGSLGRQYAALGRVCLSLAHTPDTISFNTGRVG